MPRKASRRQTKRHNKKAMKGGYYGASGAIAPGAMQWSSSTEMGDWAVSKRGGNTMIGARRKRKGTKKTRRHKLRGGSRYGAVSASFQGTGSRGLADAVAVNTKGPDGSSAGPSLGAWNDNGAHPGSGHSSFVTVR